MNQKTKFPEPCYVIDGKATPLPDISGKQMAETFWGKAWCAHFESCADYSNRLGRGKTYARQGNVRLIEITPGLIKANVQGTRRYWVKIQAPVLSCHRWQRIKKAAQGSIKDLPCILQGKIPADIISAVCDAKNGIFPRADELDFSCSCPDWSILCKHVASVLYTFARIIDHDPTALFLFRGVDPAELLNVESIINAATAPVVHDEDILESDDFSALFGITIDMDAAVGTEDTASTPKMLHSTTGDTAVTEKSSWETAALDAKTTGSARAHTAMAASVEKKRAGPKRLASGGSTEKHTTDQPDTRRPCTSDTSSEIGGVDKNIESGILRELDNGDALPLDWAVPPDKAVQADGIICCLCGKKFKNLGSHLRVHGLTSDDYRIMCGYEEDFELSVHNAVQSSNQQ